MESNESACCDRTSTGVELVHPDVCGMHLGSVGECGVSKGVTQEVDAGVVVIFDPELKEVESVEAVGADATPDVVVVGTGTTAGVAVMLVVTTVATVTPPVDG